MSVDLKEEIRLQFQNQLQYIPLKYSGYNWWGLKWDKHGNLIIR